MCFKENIDDYLEKIKKCHDPKEIHRLLEEINSCKTSTKKDQTASYMQDPGCNCRLHQKIYLQNLIEHILTPRSG